MTELREYQFLALQHLHQRVVNGHRRLYVTLPTGTGKSLILARFAKHRVLQGRVLVLIHRQDIARQLALTLCEEGLEVGLLMQGHRDMEQRVLVATLPSLLQFLDAVLEASTTPVATVLIDEAHHAVKGSTYEQIVTTLESRYGNEQVVTVGFTATPYRSHANSMLTVLPTCAFARDIPEMILQKVLAPLVWVPIAFDLDLSTLPSTVQDGEYDYDQHQLVRTLHRDLLTQEIVGHIAPMLEHRPTLVFALTVDHAEALAHAFRECGVSAMVVSGAMSQKQRERTFEQWRAGELQVVCNCALLTEGFDFPAIAALVFVRPTRSPALYLQMLGRGMRLAPGKQNCLVFELVGQHSNTSAQITLPQLVVPQRHEKAPLSQPKRLSANPRYDSLFRNLSTPSEETGVSLLDPLGASCYRWQTLHHAYFALVNAEVVAIVERDPAGSGLYRSRLH